MTIKESLAILSIFLISLIPLNILIGIAQNFFSLSSIIVANSVLLIIPVWLVMVCLFWQMMIRKSSLQEMGVIGSKITYYIFAFVFGVLLFLIQILIYGDESRNIFNNFSSDIYSVIAFISLSFLTPLSEELYCRGYLFQAFSKKFNIVTAVIVSSLIFSFLHLIGLDAFDMHKYAIQLFLNSIVFSLLFHHSNSIFPSSVCHGIYNALVYLSWGRP